VFSLPRKNVFLKRLALWSLLWGTIGLMGCPDPITVDGEETEPDFLYRVENGAMVDAEDAHLYFRGMNVANAAKGTEDHLVDITDEDIAIFKENGIRQARLLTFWKAITPDEPGVVDEAYLDKFLERVKKLTDNDIYVVIDMHQDLWGAPFVNHGAPTWACPEELQAGYEAQSPWWSNYTSEQVSGCFDHFWESPTLQDNFASAWVAMAEKVCGEDKVLGFDLMNEPYTGQDHMTASFDNEYLMGLYEMLMEKIDTVCGDRLYFVEPSELAQLGLADPMVFPTRFKDRMVYAGHFYPSYVHESDGGGYDGDKDALRHIFMRHFEYYINENIPVWVGELGGYTSSANFDVYLQDLYGLFHEYGFSSAWWDYSKSDGGFSFLSEAGSVKSVFEPVFGTPHPLSFPSPISVTPFFESSDLTVSFQCVEGKRIQVAVPHVGCSCAHNPVGQMGALETSISDTLVWDVACEKDGETTLTCSCED
jgi:endoglycosylceramidase